MLVRRSAIRHFIVESEISFQIFLLYPAICKHKKHKLNTLFKLFSITKVSYFYENICLDFGHFLDILEFTLHYLLTLFIDHRIQCFQCLHARRPCNEYCLPSQQSSQHQHASVIFLFFQAVCFLFAQMLSLLFFAVFTCVVFRLFSLCTNTSICVKQ